MQHLLDIYGRATPEQLERGRRWYRDAREHCARIADETGVTIEQAVAAVAVTSPDAQLRTNLAWASRACATRGEAAVGRYPNKMRELYGPALRGECDPADACRGSKVSAFYAAILGDPDAVVLDRWALRAARHHRDTATPKQYARIADQYREAAALVDEEPRAFQAIVWIVLRDAHKRNGRAVKLADLEDLTPGKED